MIGNRLKNLLEELNIKQNELAQKSQVTEATISNYISGKQLPKLGVVERIADTLNVSVDYLLGRDVYRTGNRIKQLRLQKGINQEVLAKKLGITQQMVSLYEKNINEPDIETIKKLSEIFNCSTDYLLGRDVDNIENTTRFDKEKLANLIKKAIGNDRSLNQYALHCQVSSAHISRLSRGLLNTPPTPQVLQKMANASQGRVTYDELMKTCGYVDESDTKIQTNKNKVEQILELADGLNIQEANYLIKQLNKAVIKIEKEAK